MIEYSICKTSTTVSSQGSRYSDKGNITVHQQFLLHWLYTCKYKGILNQEGFILFTTKDANILKKVLSSALVVSLLMLKLHPPVWYLSSTDIRKNIFFLLFNFLISSECKCQTYSTSHRYLLSVYLMVNLHPFF